MPTHELRVYPLPRWIDVQRLLGSAAWEVEETVEGLCAKASIEREHAADIGARLRGLGMGGHPIAVEIEPELPRAAVREARQRDAQARRDTTPATEGTVVELDEQARYSWTPEVLARAIGREAAGLRVVDACCGAGGNAIGFALEGCEVVAIEQDAGRLELARRNAKAFGVEDRIEFIHGDAGARVGSVKGAVLFIDPPWGRDWDHVVTRADQLDPLLRLIRAASGFTTILCKLPPSIDPQSLRGRWGWSAVFGEAPGDRHRVKFVLAIRGAR